MTDREQLIQELVADFVDRRSRGEVLRADQYLARYPELRAELVEHFDTISRLDQLLGGGGVADRELGRIGDYELVRPIGRGGMGAVFLAESVKGGRPVAIKLLGSPLTQSAAAVERFRREAEIARRLRHPNIVAVYEVGEHDRCPYFVMQLVEGVTLAQVIQRMREQAAAGGTADPQRAVRELLARAQPAGPAADPADDPADEPPAEPRLSAFAVITRMMADVADGLACAHARGIVHRDVKPHNILVDAAMTPYLSDFGLAKDQAMVGLSRTGDLIGTPHYMSPEIAAAKRTGVDHSTDIYSLGVTMFEALTLGLPFAGASSHEVLSRILTQEPPRPRKLNPSVPLELQTIVLKAMAKDQVDRYATASEMAEDLRRVLRLEPITAKPPSLRRRLERFGARHRTGLLVATLLVLGAGALTIGSADASARASKRLLAETVTHLHAGDYLSAAATIERARERGWSPRHEELRDQAFGIVPVTVQSVPGGTTVAVRVVDPRSGRIAEHGVDATTGADGVAAFRLGLGTYEITVAKAGFGHGEYRIEVTRGGSGTRTLTAVLRATPDCTKDMVEIAGGDYEVGWTDAAQSPNTFMLAARTVHVAPFFIDRTEVSRAQYAEFARSTGRPVPWPDPALAGESGRLPATRVTMHEAAAYAEWAGKRLPTELEWEVAARGADARRYSWGNGFDETRAVLGAGLVAEAGVPVTIPARRRAVPVDAPTDDVAACGCLHLIGNVSEWTSTPWHLDRGPADEAAWRVPRAGQVVQKGSSYLLPSNDVACLASARTPRYHDERAEDVGFRCAKSLLP